MKCKNCGKEIYQAKSHGCWYHKEDDCTICGAHNKMDFKRLFDEAEPKDFTSKEVKKNKMKLSHTLKGRVL